MNSVVEIKMDKQILVHEIRKENKEGKKTDPGNKIKETLGHLSIIDDSIHICKTQSGARYIDFLQNDCHITIIITSRATMQYPESNMSKIRLDLKKCVYRAEAYLRSKLLRNAINSSLISGCWSANSITVLRYSTLFPVS